MSWTPDYQFRASYVLWHLRSFTQMNFREFDAAHESVCGTKRTCWGRLTMSAPEGKTDVPREPGHFRF
jgi:hypothetical protein